MGSGWSMRVHTAYVFLKNVCVCVCMYVCIYIYICVCAFDLHLSIKNGVFYMFFTTEMEAVIGIE